MKMFKAAIIVNICKSGRASLNLELSHPTETDSGATSGRGKPGFTLVEVIVVLVILAILAAIAIPALTGYIDKARDKSEISKARNLMVAVRTVLVDNYAEGRQDSYFMGFSLNADTKIWKQNDGSAPGLPMSYGYDDFRDKLTALTGEGPWAPWGNPGSWDITLVGSPDSAVANADGFMMEFAPDGVSAGSDIVVVTYKVGPMSMSDNSYGEFSSALAEMHYEPNAGYEVYHLAY
jgi:prepilin-type N-terminal cleavage/methylation domain-containing protein